VQIERTRSDPPTSTDCAQLTRQSLCFRHSLPITASSPPITDAKG
jgi:hypothetical protein